MGQTEQDSGKTYADIWGEAVHSNRHLRVLSMGLAGLVLLLVVIIIRLSSVELPKPIVVRVDEVGRAEALAYDAVEAQADPLDPTTKYFLNRWIDDYYSRRGATVETAWPRSLRFLTTTLANEAFRAGRRERRHARGGRRPRRAASGTGDTSHPGEPATPPRGGGGLRPGAPGERRGSEPRPLDALTAIHVLWRRSIPS